MERQMATVRRISGIEPIDGADRIETAHVDGWQCVVGKGEFEEGQKAVYFEIDSFLPTDDERFSKFAERGTKVMASGGVEREGHVLKTVRLRGTLSQGLLMSLSDLGLAAMDFDVGEDLTDILGIWKYERPEAGGDGAGIGGFDTSIAPITDAVRIQNIDDAMFATLAEMPYTASVKVDGMSMTCAFDDRHGRLRLFTHRRELDLENAKNERYLSAISRDGLRDFCESHPNVAVQFEFAGAKVQNDRLALGEGRCFVFAVWKFGEGAPTKVDFLSDDAYAELHGVAAPRYDIDLDALGSVANTIGAIDGLKGNVSKDRYDEGIVIHFWGSSPDGSVEDKLGKNMEVKVISNRYLLKDKD